MTIDQAQTADYRKTIRLQASASDVFDALTTVTEPCVMHVDRADRPTLVEWTVTECAFLHGRLEHLPRQPESVCRERAGQPVR